MSRVRKGHDLEHIGVQFSASDLQNFEPMHVFNSKWIILKNIGPRGEAHCYEVCDKKAKQFGTLYVEIADEGVSSVANHVEFLHKQFSVGNSHRFTTILDVGFINNHVYYMVLFNRAGPLMSTLLKPRSTLSPSTVAFIAIDIISLTELLTSTGFVWRSFNPEQWVFDVKTRTFCLTDPTDVIVISDKRYRPINESHFRTAQNVKLSWKSEDLSHAPISFTQCSNHRMSELDMMESLVYVIYKMAYSKLPWKGVVNPQKMVEMKNEFMESLPDVPEFLKTDEDLWLDTALRNVTEYLKLARKMQEQIEKQPVRDGAWCPNGARAGALISTIKYREIIDDFHRIVTKGKPAWSCHWKDVKLDWDREFSHTPKSLKVLEKSEKREIALEVALEAVRLEGSRVHYTIMKNHTEAVHRLNAVSVENYLKGKQEEDLKSGGEDGIDTRVKRKRRTKLEMEEEKHLKLKGREQEEKVKTTIKKAVWKEEESTSASLPTIEMSEKSARAARFERRFQNQESFVEVGQVSKMKKPNKKGKVKVICIDEDVKIEEPDDYDPDEN